MKIVKIIKIITGTLLIVLSACSTMQDASNAVKDSMFTYETVKPWQRGVLAEQQMQLIDDGMQNYADEHIFFSKEGSVGGKGVGGGGCGCN